MQIISRELFNLKQVYNTKSFRRLKTILDDVNIIEDNVAYNAVDSIVYVRNPLVLGDKLAATRKYMLVLYVQAGQVELAYANSNQLKPISKYCDLCDEQYFMGETNTVVVEDEQIIIFDVDEAVKVVSASANYLWCKVAIDEGIK